MNEETPKRWLNETEYLENVTGYRIVERQAEINDDPNMFVVATQVFPLIKNTDGKPFGVLRKETQTIHRGYDAFIYYKRLPVEEGNPKEENTEEIIEETPSTLNIQIPE